MDEDVDLFNLTVHELLVKFGAGSHKPGSGSAAALQALIAAKMLNTVIELTLDPKRMRAYAAFQEQFTKHKQDLASFTDELTKLFHTDASQFDQVIKARDKRDAEREPVNKHLLKCECVALLLNCCDTPLDIARQAYQIMKIGLFTFEHGFQTARGDSAVGIRAAISAMEGCLSIIQLNLRDCIYEDRFADLSERSKKLKAEVLKARAEADRITQALEDTIIQRSDAHKEIRKYCNTAAETPNDRSVIRELMEPLQNLLLTRRKNPNGGLVDAQELLSAIGYQLIETDLGDMLTEQGNFRIGGMIDPAHRLIRINSTLPIEQKRFTIAHELGHAVLHPGLSAHRDIPIDHERKDVHRDQIERQGDQFAALWLMPEKLVRLEFVARFGSDTLALNESSSMALALGGIGEARQRLPNVRSFARLIAGASLYDGSIFEPMAKIVQVSVEAMAIRLEELRIVVM